MPMRYFAGDSSALGDLISILRGRGLAVLSYRLWGDLPVFGEVESLRDLSIGYSDVQGPASYRLVRDERGFFRHSYYSPKYALHPPIQDIYEASNGLRAVPARVDTAPMALFGIKPCDLAAIEVLDRVLESDDFYRARRSAVAYIVVEECVEPGDTCFCGSTGTGPAASGGFDVAYARLEGRVLFRAGSERGLRLLEELKLGEAPGDLVERYDEVMEEARRKSSRLPPLDAVIKALEDSAASEGFWREVSARCVGCANCNMVCPTCFCTEFIDSADLSGRARRQRQWFGCLSYTYGQVAGMHFRPELFMRYRHFVLHKFVFYQRQIGLPGCVGCGRCITWCPMGIDLGEVVSRVVSHGSG